MRRNIFQSESPSAMLQAVRQVVHENLTPAQALEVNDAGKTAAFRPRPRPQHLT